MVVRDRPAAVEDEMTNLEAPAVPYTPSVRLPYRTSLASWPNCASVLMGQGGAGDDSPAGLPVAILAVLYDNAPMGTSTAR